MEADNPASVAAVEAKPLPAMPLLDLFGCPVTQQEKKTRRSRRREVARFWAERDARGHPPPEVILDYYLQAALESGDKAMAIDICKAFLPYRLPRLQAIMVAPPGQRVYSVGWDDGTATTAAAAILAEALSGSDPPGT